MFYLPTSGLARKLMLFSETKSFFFSFQGDKWGQHRRRLRVDNFIALPILTGLAYFDGCWAHLGLIDKKRPNSTLKLIEKG